MAFKGDDYSFELTWQHLPIITRRNAVSLMKNFTDDKSKTSYINFKNKFII